MKPLSTVVPVSLQFQLAHKCSTLALVRLFVAAAATVYQEPNLWRTEGQELLHLCVTKNFSCLSPLMHDLI